MRGMCKRNRRTEAGSSDFSLVLMGLAAVFVFSLVTQFNSCVRDGNRKKNGWVEVDEDYPYEQYQPELPNGAHIDDY
jgi:hypothetical protein